MANDPESNSQQVELHTQQITKNTPPEPNEGPSGLPTLKRHDPTVAYFDSMSVSNFEKWYLTQKKLKIEKQQEIRVPGTLIKWGTAKFFENIWKRTGWLRNDHIDAIINMLIMKSKREPGNFLSDWTVIETYLWQSFQSCNVTFLCEKMSAYVKGKQPLSGAIPWTSAEKIYGIAHVLNNHWVCYEVCITEQKIIVYDSQSEVNNWDQVWHGFEQMSRYIPALFLRTKVWESRPCNVPLLEVWDVVRGENTPQQANNHDCGILAVKIFECLVSGHPLQVLDPARCGIFRKAYCKELFDLSEQLQKN